MKGKLKARCSVEYNRSYKLKAPECPPKPCKKLPSNCYSDTFLNGLNGTEKLILDMNKTKDNLENFSKSIDTARWFD